MSLPNIVFGSEELTLDTSTNESTPVGTKMVIEDGRTFRFSENAGTAAVAGRVFMAAVHTVANNGAQAVDTLAAGVSVLTGVGASNAAVAVNLLKDGYIFVDTAAQLDSIHRIKSNTNIASGGTGSVTLYSPTTDAISAAETVSYIVNSYRNIVIAAAPQTAPVVGVITTAIAADSFGWIATGGLTKVLVDGSWLNGDEVIASDGTAGSLEIRSYQEATDANRARENAHTAGYSAMIGSTGLYGICFLTLDS